ncbi:MAG: phosphatase PAP2 family protein [Gemmatimonadota bacterium]
MSVLVLRVRALLMCTVVWCSPELAHAQGGAAVPGAAVASDSAHHRLPLFTRADPLILGAFVLGAAAIGPFDRNIARAIREPSVQTDKAASRAAKAFNFIGSPGVLLASVAAYGVGRVGHFEHVADLGLHTTEAIFVSAGVTSIIKGFAGRQRPGVAGVDDPDDFKFGGGFGKHASTSFPSGHATAAFATATLVTLEMHHWKPSSTWYVAPVMFGGAALVGVARLYTNAHWSSDVVMGAGIGTLTALKVFRYNHVTSRHNRVNRWLLSAVPSVSPSLERGGAALGWSFAAPR